jgi:hypothetical protein
MTAQVFFPLTFFVGPGPLNIVIPLKNVTEIDKSNQIRAEPIKLTHNKADLPSPLYFSFNDKDAWITDIQTFIRQNLGSITPSESAMPPPPPDFTAPLCPKCGNPMNYIEQYQKWYCYKDQKYV